jgi:hypothetical protein
MLLFRFDYVCLEQGWGARIVFGWKAQICTDDQQQIQVMMFPDENDLDRHNYFLLTAQEPQSSTFKKKRNQSLEIWASS